MRFYYTIFDKNYLIQGYALYSSLKNLGEPFSLFVLAMDEIVYEILTQLNHIDLVSIRLCEVENYFPEIKNAKVRVTHGQYCWINQPAFGLYLLQEKNLPLVTYLEADSLFFSTPEPIFNELGLDNVTIVPHRYTPKFDQTLSSGTYCVQFNAFRNNASSKDVLKSWLNSCLLYDKSRPLYHPGQICLDDWVEKFEGIHEVRNIGAGVAPWNIQQYQISADSKNIYVNGVPVIFFHYHQYARYTDGDHELSYYPLPKLAIEHFYKRYVKMLLVAHDQVQQIFPNFSDRKVIKKKTGIRAYFSQFRRYLNGSYNIYKDEELHRDCARTSKFFKFIKQHQFFKFSL